ncbi:putative disease resistance RPP13-like protein 1 [Vitis vinifera]|uniref:Putative disease resistance RPP13-like protein 1 n=1 Tax=Vitis vinifera TaxID=29760 RepID=A0A438FIE6_VITVI|nr:putative disease resistance RPP13-like protein 1 [Vitis vinifera]
MADVLLSASLQVLFERLASPELINFIRRRNLSHELLNELKRKLVVVLNVLDDAEVKQFSNPNVKEWLVHVKDAVYGAEDLLDEIATDALRCKMEAADSQTGGTLKAWKWNKFSACVKAPFAIKSMESRVRGTIDQLEKIAGEIVRLGLAEGGGEKRSPRPRSPMSTSLEDGSIVVGRDEIQKEMVEWLLSDNTTGDKMGVMSIVGMGGSGKTTLARLLYNDEGVKEHFDLKAWVCVSTEFLLIKQLSNKKFLLVLDDVWNLNPRDECYMEHSDCDGWESLRTPLLAAAEGSKIVVTSRDKSVAEAMKAAPTHDLGKLSSDDSWSLFKSMHLEIETPTHSLSLKPIGRQIVDKCQGLPLAVKALGCLLYSKVEKGNGTTTIQQREADFIMDGRRSFTSTTKRRKENGRDRGATTHDILNKLQPHPNLKQLSITNYPGEGFPNWLGDPSVLNLVSLELRGCGNCSTLPPLGQLTQLKYLQISRMNGVECVGDEFYGNASFQFLETLSFEDMQNWEKWLCCGEFPRLQKLFIRKCPKLTGKLPELLLSLVELQIDGCPQLLMASLTVPAIRQLKMVDFGKLQLQMAGCDFTALQTSEIEILDVSHFSRSLHKVGLPTTLKSLLISKCSKLEILVPELFRCHLPVLESLEIKDGVIDDSLSLSFSLGIFPKLTNFTILNLKGLEKLSILVSEGDPTSLCSLSLDGCPDLESIELHALNLESCKIYRCSSSGRWNLWDCPELLFQREGKLAITDITPQVEWDLQRLTSLTHFKIKGGCEDIELFPKECLLPSSLTSLQIVELSNLKSLTAGDRFFNTLSSLKRLEIDGCSRLQSLTEVGLQHLTSLERLCIENCPMLQSLTEVGLQHLTSLESLWIGNCPMLQSLTKVGLQHLTSLKTLGINKCPMLQSLTKVGLQHLTSLKTLGINNCLFIVSNQDEYRRFVMINKVSIMTMEKHVRCLNSPLVQQLAVIGRPCKMCSNQVDFCKRKWNMKKDRLFRFSL